MKKLNGFEEAKVISSIGQLPKGGYIAKILDCKEESSASGYNWLAFSFDITEGEYKDHFKQQYQANTNEEKKWRGTYNAFIPDENSQYYEQNLSRFKTMFANIEESNPGYHWDWDEKKLKGKAIGVLFREKEITANDGSIITITECCGLRSVQQIKDGKFKIPGLKKAQGSTTNSTAFVETAVDDDDDLPF